MATKQSTGVTVPLPSTIPFPPVYKQALYKQALISLQSRLVMRLTLPVRSRWQAEEILDS
jgi:hypothetical protein